MTARVNHADPRVKRTRQLLLNAFRDVLMQKSFSDITIQDIADKATINRGTFYDHFVDKYALLDEFIRDQLQQHLAKELGDSITQQQSLAPMMIAIFGFIDTVFHECRPRDREFDSIIQTIIIDELQVLLQRWAETHHTRWQDRQEETITLTIWSWSIFGVARAWQQGKITGSLQEIADRTIATLQISL